MARTNLSGLWTTRLPITPSQQNQLSTKLAEHDTALDALETAGAFSYATAAALLAAAGPAATVAQYAYVAEFDAFYKWNAADATAADTYRVISATGGVAGRWILAGDRITLSPRGGVLDDWARVMAACSAMAYKGEVHLAAGDWRCDTKQVTPNGTTLRGNSGVSIVSTLTENEHGGAEDACPFYNSGGTAQGTTATLNADAAEGALTISVASASGVAVGDRINLRNGTAWRCAREVVGISGTTITLDRPLYDLYPSGSTLAVLPTCRDIRIHGGGMSVSGTGDRIVEFISAWDCLVEDIRGSGEFKFFAFGYDVGSRDSHFKRCSMDCEDYGGAGFTFEYADHCSAEDCHSRRATAHGFLLTGAHYCTIIGGSHTESASEGLALTVNIATDTRGSCNNTIIGGTYSNNVDGIVISNGSSGNTFIGVDVSDNSGIGIEFTPGTSLAAPNNNTIIGGSAKRNAVAAVYEAGGGKGNRVIGQAATDNGSNAAGHVYVATTGCELSVADPTVLDTGVLPSTKGAFYAAGAGAVIRVSGGYFRSTGASGYKVFCEVQNGARAELYGGNMFVPTSANTLGIYVTNGLAVVSDYRQTGGDNGVYLIGASATARIEGNVDTSACGTPFATSTGGTYLEPLAGPV